MIGKLLLFTVIPAYILSALYKPLAAKELESNNKSIDNWHNFGSVDFQYPNMSVKPFSEEREVLQNQPNLKNEVIEKAIAILQCSEKFKVEHDNILSIIDYSLPANEKRMWVFDLTSKKILFHTYVSHGIKSGTLNTDSFSNKNDSKATSMGVYRTEQSYQGREGLSLRLEGLERGFNDNAMNRYIVMHGGWYVDEYFIKKYGRAGRSWGCPALPLEVSTSVINVIKDKSLLIMYYPNEEWLSKSKYLNCNNYEKDTSPVIPEALASGIENPREDILFVDLRHKNNRADTDPLVGMTTENYERIFKQKTPVTRMFRRQIDNREYLALSKDEFNQLVTGDKANLNAVVFITADLKMRRGYYITEMRLENLGKINDAHTELNNYKVDIEGGNPIDLRPTSAFIRWVGL